MTKKEFEQMVCNYIGVPAEDCVYASVNISPGVHKLTAYILTRDEEGNPILDTNSGKPKTKRYRTVR